MKKFLAWLLACVMLLSLAAKRKRLLKNLRMLPLSRSRQKKRPLRTKPLPKK